MIDFFGRFVGNLYGFFNDPILMTGMYVLIALLIVFPAIKKDVENVMISPYMKQELADIRKTHKNNADKSVDDIRTMLMKYQYGMLASPICTLLEMLFGLFLGLSMYSDRMQALPIEVFGLSGFKSPAKYFGTGVMTDKLATILFIIALAIQYFHDMQVQKKLIVEQATMDTILLFATAAALFFLPLAVVWYWIMFELLELLVFFVYTTTRRAYIAKRVDVLRAHAAKASKKDSKKKKRI